MRNSAPKSLATRPYLQSIATFYNYIDGLPAKNVCAIARTTAGIMFAACDDALFCMETPVSQWTRVRIDRIQIGSIQTIQAASDGGIWVTSSNNLCHLDAFGAETVTFSPGGRPIAVAGSSAAAWVLMETSLWRSSDMLAFPFLLACQPTSIVLDAKNVPVVATDHGILRLVENVFHFLPTKNHLLDTPGLPFEHDIRDMTADNAGNLWVATPHGIQLYCAGAWITITGKDGLPIEDVEHLAIGPNGSLWIGSKRGVARLLDGQWQYFAGRRWLPDDQVNALAVDAQGGAWIATSKGLAHIHFDRMSLEQKSHHYRNITLERHFRDGFVTDCHLERPGDLESILKEASDNDGLWTSLWICAASFRFAVTQAPDAREDARQSMQALLSLVRLTGISGFPARAIIRHGERVHQSDPGPNWRASPVEPGVLFKDDTSSDEIAGHFLAWYVYSELVATQEERASIASTCHAVMTHILDHGYMLLGPDGQPTRWGKWSPHILNGDPHWAAEAGLGALELLSHLKVAQHLSPCLRFQEAYDALIRQSHFALNIIRQKKLPPEADDNHSDDELAACAFYPLLQLETDPHLRQIYLLGLEWTQRALRPKRSPFYNFVYGACSEKPCNAEDAVAWLEDSPLDLTDWTMLNSHRDDVTAQSESGRFGELQIERALRPGEMRVSKWNQNPFAPDGGRAGMHEEDGAFWLLPYWMARFHGILMEEDG